MDNALNEILWKQFGASIDMLGNAVSTWPEEEWDADPNFFYQAYHCILFLDYYATTPPTHFAARLPFSLTAKDRLPKGAVDDLLPSRQYSKRELLDYLKSSREKCKKLILGLTDEKLKSVWIEKQDDLAPGFTMSYSVFEILLYNMRHVQHHSAQLNLLLRKQINRAPNWIAGVSD